jgi:hypothetical protein
MGNVAKTFIWQARKTVPLMLSYGFSGNVAGRNGFTMQNASALSLEFQPHPIHLGIEKLDTLVLQLNPTSLLLRPHP